MDPLANVREQIQIATMIADGSDLDRPGHNYGCDHLERLAELVLALHEWRRSGGPDPYTDEDLKWEDSK